MEAPRKESLTLVLDAHKESEKNEEKIKTPRRILTFDQVLKEECEPLEYILSPWLIKQGIVLVYAARGIGKTYFAFNVSRAISCGGEFLKWSAPVARKVLYLDGEMQFPLVKERVEMMTRMCGNQGNGNLFLLTPDKYGHPVPDVATKEGQRIIDAHADDLGVQAIVIDNIATMMPSLKKNSNDDWHLLIQPWLLDLRRRGFSVMIVDHSGKFKKDEIEKSRGATGKEDIADTVIRLSRPGGYTSDQGARFNIEFTKNRHFYGVDAMEFEAWLKPDENGIQSWYYDDVKLPIYEEVCRLYNQGKMQKEIVDKLHIAKSWVSTLVRRGIDEGLISGE